MFETYTKTIDVGGVPKVHTYTNINNLHNWEDNPREIKTQLFDFLVTSLQSEGQLMPMLVDVRPEKLGTILGGNMTFLAWTQRLNNTEVWIEPVLPESDEHAIAIALKHNANYGNYIEIKLQELAQKLKDAGYPLNEIPIPAAPEINLEELLQRVSPDEVTEDEAPDVSSEPAISQLGEVYQLGRHRLMCGDATKIEDVEKLMNGQKADMVFTDPPYNIASDSINFASDISKSMNDLKNSEWDKNFDIQPFLNLLPSFVKKDSTIYIWTSHFLFDEIVKQLKTWCNFVSYCIWSKPNPMPSLSKRHWTWNTEMCIYATLGSHTFNFPNDGHALSTWTTTKQSDGTHPTQKPIDLCANPIYLSSNENSLILDLFGGSGSTLIACEQTNRTCYMMELDPAYCDVIRKRYAKILGREDEWQTLTPQITQ